MPKFGPAVYNTVAKRIREQMAVYTYTGTGHSRNQIDVGAQNVLIELALEFARTFKKDNELFDPLHFLDACSPDPEIYPISELWNG